MSRIAAEKEGNYPDEFNLSLCSKDLNINLHLGIEYLKQQMLSSPYNNR
jgi:hypothetical protein